MNYSDFPKQLHIETTVRCNLNCEYCVVRNYNSPKNALSFEDFETLAPNFQHLGTVLLSGMAEPLMNRDIARFIQRVKIENTACIVRIISNAMLLNEKRCHELVESGLDSFGFSLDCFDPTMNDAIRQGSDTKKIIKNVRLLNRIKSICDSNKPALAATVVLQKKNYRGLAKLMDLFADLGVHTVTLNGLEPYNQGLLKQVLWQQRKACDDLPDVLEQALESSQMLGIQLRMPDFRPAEPSCPLVNMPIIAPNGDVTPCSVLAYDRDAYFAVDGNRRPHSIKSKNRKKVMGNIFREGLTEIWNSSAYRSFREAVLKKEFPDECSNCLMKHGIICVTNNRNPETIIAEMRSASD